jgi:hypothetical protein
MKAVHRSSSIFVFLVVLTLCNGSFSSAAGVKNLHNLTAERTVDTAATKPPTLEDEAVSAVKEKLWNQHTTKCGESYYSKEDFRGMITFREYRKVSFIPKRRGPSSEADTLNGILWKGEVEILNRLYRENQGGTWSSWKERTPGGGFPIGATKRQSGWSVTQLIHITRQQRVSCSEVPA